MRLNEKRIATKYAQAFYNLYGEQLSDDLYEKLPTFVAFFERERSIVLLAQIVHRDVESRSAFGSYFADSGYGRIFDPLISLLTQQRRLILLPLVLKALYATYLENAGIMHFVIESPVELTQKEQEGFVSFLGKKTGKEIRYTLKDNPALLAGVKMYSDTLGYEHSIQQKLYQL